ncbi:DUF4344 domain-containing metallopeptidase [Streptomyces narbonensis]|uniref:DUF4344 domain-containing metallopeptidase n=1 Tax=Streptomyces narbonensis TaxID=67333 RepID=UPI00167AA19E|nr:DUF4344 domain-containing metallopeptidase [Streptomyces narbonensis]GGV96953.1 hypothetical protein GCM10010230_16420 [Streptomyces narbonensis]
MRFHRRWAAALAAAALLTFGATSATSATAVPAVPGPGGLVVSYEPAETEAGLAEQQFLQQNEVLESAAAHANALIGLPRDIPLVAVSCDPPNAYWDPESQAILFCYEYAALFRGIFSERNTEGSPAEQARATDEDVIGVANSAVFHELAHALIQVYDLPATGREEDSADQLATLLLSEDSLHREYAISDIEAWGALAELSEQGDLSDKVSDVHALDSQRYYNAICWLYGSDPQTYDFVVLTEANPEGFLPESRAVGCPGEYAQMQKAWSTLLAPYLK